MRFNLLGPLEVTKDGAPVPLGGLNRRATLGLLLLRPNTVVATADVIRALWGGEPPLTARKMVQNAVAALRDVLAAEDGVSLQTTAPGYMLRLDAHRIDLAGFRDRVKDGRTAFRAEAWDGAARHLRDALALWRGPALADIAEAGMRWPELDALHDERLTALEDCAEAELALGLHRELLGELGAVAEAEPARERLCGLVMLALYRCGQQADALNAFHRTRTVLVEEFGLDPAPELHRLQRAILTQDPDLLVPRAQVPSRPARTAGTAAPVPERSRRPMAERRHASVVMVETRVRDETDDPERVDEVLAGAAQVIGAEAAHFGGLVRGPLGPYRLVVLGVPRAHGDDAARAIGAALAIRRRLGTARPVAVRIAVATGEVLAGYRDENDAEPAELTGAVLDRCQRMLARARPDGVRVCDRTRRAAGSRFGWTDGDPENGWHVTDDRPSPVLPPPTPLFVGRERERERLWELLDQTLRARRPHLVTVVGEPGIGKSRLVSEFGREVREHTASVRVVSGDVASLGIARHEPWTPGCPSDRRGRVTAPGPWSHRLESLAEHAPLVAVVEDLHHTPAALPDILGRLRERPARVPLLVIATARPELAIEPAPDTSTIVLGPLADDEIAVLAGPLSPGRTALAGGNPLFAQEYARDAPDEDAAEIPAQIRDLLTARLDTLPIAEKVVLRIASIFEPAVSPRSVAAVSERTPEEVAGLLRSLERRGVLRSADGAASAYAFVQELLRRVAYDQLPRRHRITLHGRAAAWISGLPADRGDLLVHHHRQMIALADGAPEAAEQANRALTDAGHRAGMTGAHHVAARCYQGALELSGSSPVPERQRLRSLYRQSLRRVGPETPVR